MSAHVTEVSCHSISGLRQSYNDMCLETYYLIIEALRLLTFHFAEAVRYGLISLFPLPYKHVWTLSYTYRVLISPIDESSEQRNNKTKPKHNNFLRSNEPEDGKILFSATPRRGHAMSWHEPSLRRSLGTPDIAQIFYHFVHFSTNPTKKPQIL